MDDLISREAALDCFNDWVDRHGDVHAADEDTVYQKIEALPSAVRTGKWIKLDMHRGMAQYKCSACNSECYVPECMGEPMYMFCPNCGARMEEE